MFTVLGARGFVGSALVAHLSKHGDDVLALDRGNMPAEGTDLDIAFYCIGVTSDYRRRFLDTAESHVSTLIDVIRRYRFRRIVYLSSTRVYSGSNVGSETSSISVNASDPMEIYGLSKLTGESIVAGLGPRGVVVRLSNVLGVDPRPQNFVFDLCRQALAGRVQLRSSPSTKKDYIHVADVVRLLPNIASRGTQKCYNLAFGQSIPTSEIVDILHASTGCQVEVAEDGLSPTFPEINVSRLNAEFGSQRLPPLSALPALLQALRMEVQ